MATIKPFTDLKQSKILAEILPLGSADMCYIKHSSSNNPSWEFNEDFPPMILGDVPINEITAETLPCWSLMALLDILPKIISNVTLFIETSAALWHRGYRNIYTARADNPVDACYEMIIRLHELNLL